MVEILLLDRNETPVLHGALHALGIRLCLRLMPDTDRSESLLQFHLYMPSFGKYPSTQPLTTLHPPHVSISILEPTSFAMALSSHPHSAVNDAAVSHFLDLSREVHSLVHEERRKFTPNIGLRCYRHSL